MVSPSNVGQRRSQQARPGEAIFARELSGLSPVPQFNNMKR